MVSTLIWVCAILVLTAVSVQSQAQSNVASQNTPKQPVPNDPLKESGVIVAEEVVVESSLNIRNPSAPVIRRVRDVLYFLVPETPLVRVKRQFQNQGFGPSFPKQEFGTFPQNGFFRPNNYDNSQSTAQSNSHSHANGPFGSQNADALAGAQAFQTSGPTGSFGATANNANTQTLDIGPFGSAGGFSNAGGQSYNLPNGQTLNIAYNNVASFNPNGRPSTSQGTSIAIGG